MLNLEELQQREEAMELLYCVSLFSACSCVCPVAF